MLSLVISRVLFVLCFFLVGAALDSETGRRRESLNDALLIGGYPSPLRWHSRAELSILRPCRGNSILRSCPRCYGVVCPVIGEKKVSRIRALHIRKSTSYFLYN